MHKDLSARSCNKQRAESNSCGCIARGGCLGNGRRGVGERAAAGVEMGAGRVRFWIF